MKSGKFESELVLPYLPNKIVPPEYIRDILNEANKDFPSVDFDFEVPHTWPIEQYKDRYEELESLMVEVISWRARWFGNKETDKK